MLVECQLDYMDFDNISGLESWSLDSSNTFENASTYTTGLISCNDGPYMYAEVDGPGIIKFAWTKRSQWINRVNFNFCVDRIKCRPCEVRYPNWDIENVPLTPGPHELKWTFKMDGSVHNPCQEGTFGDGWISKINYATGLRPAPPEITEFSGPHLGYNDTNCSYSIRIDDPNKDRINCTIDWGDGTSNYTIINSGEKFNTAHKWSCAGQYNIEIKVVELTREALFESHEDSVIIRWLANIPPFADVQKYINDSLTNTTFLLEGTDYEGPIIIDHKENLEIKSLIGSRFDGNGKKYNLGIINSTGINISNIELFNSLTGIIVNNCRSCYIYSNIININTDILDNYGIYLEKSKKIKLIIVFCES